jgi:hypothetical protein
MKFDEFAKQEGIKKGYNTIAKLRRIWNAALQEGRNYGYSEAEKKYKKDAPLHYDYRLALSGGRHVVLRVPAEFGASDFVFMMQWLDFVKDGLIALPEPESEEEKRDIITK